MRHALRTPFRFALVVAFALSQALASSIAHAQPANYLIKGSGSAVYYNGSDGKRYVFPNESVYKSWYTDYTNVALISDQQLASISLGGNITYKPGTTLVKITTDPKVYAVSQYGVLHWVTSEAVASGLYGADWNKHVLDVPDTFFINYIVGYQIDNVYQYLKDQELTVANPGDNLRAPVYVPPTAPPAPPTAVTNPAKISVSLSSSNAVQNQTVQVFANVTDSTLPISKIEIYSQSHTAPLATCMSAADCSFTYYVQTAPLMETFYAVATDIAQGSYQTPVNQRPTLVVSSASSQVQMSVAPQTATVGSRVSYSSRVSGISTLSNHRIYALIPGEPVPVLWKDCGTSTECNSSSPFYRTTSLYSQINDFGQMLNSPSVLVTVTGGDAPRPVLTQTGYSSANQVDISITAPYGETIGQTIIVDGTTVDSQKLAICQGSCSITVQINTPGSLTAFTWVGGKYERSNTITVTPKQN